MYYLQLKSGLIIRSKEDISPNVYDEYVFDGKIIFPVIRDVMSFTCLQENVTATWFEDEE